MHRRYHRGNEDWNSVYYTVPAARAVDDPSPMNAQKPPRVAAVWLPLPDVKSFRDPSLARWLTRGNVQRIAVPNEPLDALAALFDIEVPAEGRASLRFYGQTGDTPAVWMAGADPVYLEPRLDHLFLHAIPPGELPVTAFRSLFDHLQTTLAESGEFAFARVGAYGYLRADQPIATAALSSQAMDQLIPNDWMPVGVGATSYRQRLSEVEMALHDHPANLERLAAGLFPVNSLWLWGGGTLPDIEMRKDLPPLFSNDPLLIGFWRRAGASMVALPVSVAECISITEGGFATLLPLVPDVLPLVEPSLDALRVALNGGSLDEVRLQFSNGLRLTLRRRHRFRYWRSGSDVPELLTGDS